MSVREIQRLLDEEYGEPPCALQHDSVYQLIVSVILSAQCTDKMVNTITPGVFERYPDVEALAAADVEHLEELIYKSGFYRNKARHLIGMAQMVAEDFDGEIPATLEQLMKLPGVARKTANVVLNVWHRKASGVVVDTHVSRISRLLGLTKQKTADKIADDLEKTLPRETWIRISLQFIQLGREVCVARRPDCPACVLRDVCPSSQV